jgi:hypothetical protein
MQLRGQVTVPILLPCAASQGTHKVQFNPYQANTQDCST